MKNFFNFKLKQKYKTTNEKIADLLFGFFVSLIILFIFLVYAFETSSMALAIICVMLLSRRKYLSYGIFIAIIFNFLFFVYMFSSFINDFMGNW